MRRKLRSALTMLGVVIGTAAIVVTISLGYAAEQTQINQLSQALDFRLLTVSPKYYGAEEGGGRAITELGDRHIAEIRRMEGVAAVTPVVNFYAGEMFMTTGAYRNENMWLLTAVDPVDFAKIWRIEEGRFFTANLNQMEFIMSDLAMSGFYDPKARVDPYEKSPYEYLEQGQPIPLPGINWLGARYKLTMRWYAENAFENNDNPTPESKEFDARLVGYFRMRPNDWMFADGAVINLNWLKKTYRDNRDMFKDMYLTEDMLTKYSEVYVMAENVDGVSDLVKRLGEYGVGVSSPLQYLEYVMEQIRTMQGFLGFIGAISMLVAALSIANTMMMSIYERTREIGVMKVLGCSLANIRAMFLSEAAFIGILGGGSGLAVSFALSYALNNVEWIQRLVSNIMATDFYAGAGGTASVIPTGLALGTWGGVVFVAICSGLYPAYRAMRLSSLAAIRNSD